ncbi:MAG: metal-dependent transcriptional regulator [Dehalococcoidales bacterium]
MEPEEKAEELLEKMWIRSEEKEEDSLALDSLEEIEKEPVEQLHKAGYVVYVDGHLGLTGKGRTVARNVVRRHRLAERLLADILGTRDLLMHEKACKFEHLLDRGLDERICTLLGHPKICPHGKLIPPGKCCKKERALAQKLVSPLSRLDQGRSGKVAYVYAPETSQLQKLMAMGVLPGAPINVIQTFPSYVFTVGQTQFAVDREIAEAIYVRLVDPETASETEGERSPVYGRGRGWRRHFRWRRPKES